MSATDPPDGFTLVSGIAGATSQVVVPGGAVAA
jgi:hypothetical protein